MPKTKRSYPCPVSVGASYIVGYEYQRFCSLNVASVVGFSSNGKALISLHGGRHLVNLDFDVLHLSPVVS